jgi:hypothetical protein
MVKVKLAPWIDRWKHGNAEDKDYFWIAGTDIKETTDEILALSMGRLVKVEEKPDVKKSKKQPIG